MKARRVHLCDICKGLENPPRLVDCAGCRRLKVRAWSARNPSKVKAWHKRWKSENREKYLALKKQESKRYRKKHRAALSARYRLYRLSRPEWAEQKKLNWRVNNRDRWLEQRRKLYSRWIYREFAEAHRLMRQIIKELKDEETKIRFDSVCQEPERITVANTERRQDKKDRLKTGQRNSRPV